MRLITIVAVLSLVLAASCGYSAEQTAVQEAYIKVVDGLEGGDYSTVYDCLSSNTRTMLDDLAEALVYYEIPMGADGRELLGEMLAGADMTDLSRDIKSITVTGERATVVTVTEDGDENLEFALEDGQWRLDFEDLIRDAIDEGLAGSGMTVQGLIDHSIDDTSFGEGVEAVMSWSSGSGSAPVTITNSLGGYDVYYVYVSPSTESEWGDDFLGTVALADQGVLTAWVNPGTYDIMIQDVDGDTYTRYEVEVGSSGYDWEVTLADMD